MIVSQETVDDPNSYNMTNGGFGFQPGNIPSIETRKKLSIKGTGRKHTEESKKKMSVRQRKENNPMYGKSLTIEHKEKLSKAKKGVPKSEEHKKQLSIAAQKRAPHNEETKLKLSISKTGNNNPMFNRKHTPESRAKMSAAIRLSILKKKQLSKDTLAVNPLNEGQLPGRSS